MSNQRYISDALKRKKQKVKKIKSYALFSAISIAIGGLIYVIHLPFFHITDIKISGNTFVDTEEINSKAKDVLEGYAFFIFPKNNILIFSKNELQKKIEENPAIVSVDISKKLFNTLIITVEEQEKQMLYCTSTVRDTCFYINQTGFIYSKVDEFIIPEQEIIIYNEYQSKTIRDVILDEEVYKSVVLFAKNLIRKDIKIGEIYIKEDGIIEFVSRGGVRIITSQFDDFQKDFSNMIALFDQNILTKDKLSEVEYIDLRFGNKVFYKNKTN